MVSVTVVATARVCVCAPPRLRWIYLGDRTILSGLLRNSLRQIMTSPLRAMSRFGAVARQFSRQIEMPRLGEAVSLSSSFRTVLQTDLGVADASLSGLCLSISASAFVALCMQGIGLRGSAGQASSAQSLSYERCSDRVAGRRASQRSSFAGAVRCRDRWPTNGRRR
jgi:hypothetical protein